MSNKKHFLIFLIIFQISTLKIHSQPSSAVPTLRYVTIPSLVLIYTHSMNKTISPDEISIIQNSLKIVRDFVWRNSACRLNLSFSYLPITDKKSITFFSTAGLPEKAKVEKDLKARGIVENQYGIILLVYKPSFAGEDTGGLRIFGQTGYAIVRFPGPDDIIYPAKKDTLDDGFIFSSLQVIEQTLGSFYLGSSGKYFPRSNFSEYYFTEKYSFFADHARIFLKFNEYFKINPRWGKIISCRDADRDGIPDDNPVVPLDELRFGSSPLIKDTDGDGLDDLAEFTAGIYRSGNPVSADTDGDGIPDGRDILPLNAIKTEIPFFTPQFENTWVTWFQIADRLDYSPESFFVDLSLKAKIFLNWDENFLYFGCEMNLPARLHLELDMNGDGWLAGKDNYQFVADPFSNQFIEIHALDATPEVSQIDTDSSGAMWDDEPEYISRFDKILHESDITLATELIDDNYIIKMKIPNNPAVPFRWHKNQTIGVRIWFDASETDANSEVASVFELYRFFKVTLK